MKEVDIDQCFDAMFDIKIIDIEEKKFRVKESLQYWYDEDILICSLKGIRIGKGGIMVKKLIIAIIIVIVLILIGGGVWYYFNRTYHPRIETIIKNPKEYVGKVITLDGEVTDRTAFFTVVKFYKLKDDSGEIIVVTKKKLPEVRSKVGVKGKIDESFSIGEEKLLVFMEESVEEKIKNK
jgi:hypothetical protein